LLEKLVVPILLSVCLCVAVERQHIAANYPAAVDGFGDDMGMDDAASSPFPADMDVNMAEDDMNVNMNMNAVPADVDNSQLPAEQEQLFEGEFSAEPRFMQAPPSARGGGRGAVLPPPPKLSKVGEAPKQSAKDKDQEDDPAVMKLNAGLDAVKQNIIQTSKQILDERKWVVAVNKITASYKEKMGHVQDHVVALRREMKKLYQKKKAIENLKLQHALDAKLKEANENLQVLQNTLKKVETKRGQLDKSHMDLRTTISGIESQLSKLKGEDKNDAEEAQEEAAKAGGADKAKAPAKKSLLEEMAM